ncbi:MAG: hypothetical protein Kow0063_31260 [Anaerolineae bacterium]
MSGTDMYAQQTVDPSLSLPRLARVGANAAIVGLWLWLFRPVFGYLAIIFSREDFRTNQLVLIGVILLVAARLRKGRPRPRLDAGPHLYYPALGLALGGSMLYLVVERFLDINTLSASLFGLASYGLLGLWIQPDRWRGGLPAALLLIGSLPFGEHMQTFIGYPMRILTATLVRDGLAAAGISSIGVDTILVLENGVSQVDLPCSGVKSLWTGMLFLIAATWVDRRPLNLRWVLIALIFAGLLFAANLARVSILVVVGQVAGWRLLAEMLHVPLGVSGFVAACLAAVILLKMGQPGKTDEARLRRPPQDASPIPHPEARGLELAGPRNDEPVLCEGGSCLEPGQVLAWPPGYHTTPRERGLAGFTRRCFVARKFISGRWAGSVALVLNMSRGGQATPVQPNWLAALLVAVIASMILIYSPRPHTGLAQPPPAWEFPAELVTKPMPLKPDEIDWLTRGGAESAERRRFEWRDITGSMILITSQTWRAHHRPERCFEVYGLSVDDSRAYLIDPDFPLRFLTLSYGRGRGSLSATYWFQSLERTTDDYGTRIWADLTPERDKWVLVTILFDGVHDPGTADLQAFYSAVHDGVAHSLKGGPK